LSLEATQAELEALEREPPRPPQKKTKKRAAAGPPRDERGRFAKTEPVKKKAARV
jgi:hypothetical protein